MKIKFIIILSLLSLSTFSQRKVVERIVKKTIKKIPKKTVKNLNKSKLTILITQTANLTEKNGLGKLTRFSSNSVKKILKDTYKLRGEKELIRVVNRLKKVSNKNSNNIKGFLAEELHYNELLKMNFIKKVKHSYKTKTSNYVKKIQKENVIKNITQNKKLYVHKDIELDLIGETSSGKKFIIEVKNIDSKFTNKLYHKYLNQAIKQKAYANENGISKVYWSNVGKGLLNPEQIELMNRKGIIILQKGSESPLVNAKINMNKIKKDLL